MIFGSQFILYIVLNFAFRKFLPTPGKYEDFKARKKIRDYHAYYFQFISLVHALAAVFLGKHMSSIEFFLQTLLFSTWEAIVTISRIIYITN